MHVHIHICTYRASIVYPDHESSMSGCFFQGKKKKKSIEEEGMIMKAGRLIIQIYLILCV